LTGENLTHQSLILWSRLARRTWNGQVDEENGKKLRGKTRPDLLTKNESRRAKAQSTAPMYKNHRDLKGKNSG